MQKRGKRLMLISNSFCYGLGYLEHCRSAIKEFLGPIKQIVFIPFALKDWNGYTDIARKGFAEIGIEVLGAHEGKGAQSNIEFADAVFVGGGNTFLLLREMYKQDLLSPIRWRVQSGAMLYLGASAGANLACPTIKTTNDMPIVDTPGLDALGLIPFQVNAHFVKADPNSRHMGESREKRIEEFLEQNPSVPVMGMPEGSWIVIENNAFRLGGDRSVVLFRAKKSQLIWSPGPFFQTLPK